MHTNDNHIQNNNDDAHKNNVDAQNNNVDTQNNNVDPDEIAKFSEKASRWWDENGDLRTLHQINPLRLNFINQHAALKDKKVIDIGCGGGILSESMAKLGAHVTGIDYSIEAIRVAKLHAHEQALALSQPLSIEYLHTTAEDIATTRKAQYDVVTCLEMLEHVPNPESVIQACAKLVKPGGHLFFSTINRNPKAYLFAILGAEYILKLLEKGTHDYAKFIKPHELAAWARKTGLQTKEMIGIHYHIFSRSFYLDKGIDVNYLVYMQKS